MMKQQALYLFFFLALLSCTKTGALAQKNKLPSIKIDSLVNFYKQADGVMVVNFWSTWCKPCIEEIPHFIEVSSQFKNDNVKLLLVSQDTRALYESGKLKEWLQEKDWQHTNIIWLNETNADYYCPKIDASWSGVIPATIIVNPSKNYSRFFEESLSAEMLEAEIKKAING